MKWYIVKLVFNINVNKGANRTQFDEQLRLVEAISPADAFFKGRSLGKQESETIVNKRGEEIQWDFIDVSDVNLLHELKDGVQVYASTHIDQESPDYINFIRQKALVLQSRDLAFA